MKFTISQSVLNKALQTVGKALSNGLILSTACYHFKNSTLSACNMEISISTELPIKGKWDVLIPGEQLKRLIASLPDQPLVFNIADDFGIQIVSSNGAYDLIGESGEHFPEITTKDGISLSMPFEDLTEALYRVSYTKLTHATDNALNAISCELSETGMQFVAFNGFSFALFNIAGKYDEVKLLLSPGLVLALSNLQLSGDCSINHSDKSISIECDSISIKGVLLDGKYLDWKPVLKVPDQSVSCSRLELIASIKRVLMFANKTSNEIAIHISSMQLRVTGEDVDLKNKAQEIIACTPGEDISIGINGIFTIEALNHLQSDIVWLYYSVFNKPLLFCENENDVNMAMLAPITLKR